MDLKNAYGVDCLQKLNRSFKFFDDKIVLNDEYEFTKDVQVTERFISLIEPKAVDGGLLIDDVYLFAKCKTIPTVTVKGVRAHMGNRPHDVYIIDYILPKGRKDFQIECTVK